MVAVNPNYRFPSAESNSVPPVNRLAERVRHYFEQHPEVSREEFLLEALGREMQLRERWGIGAGTGSARRERQTASLRSTGRPPLTAEDFRIHAWLLERLAAVNYERHGLWPKLRRFFFGNRLVRGLAYILGRPGMSENDAFAEKAAARK
jgi:hypothetical protein